MSDEKLLLSKLEKCIVSFGDEFRRRADDYFWDEHDVVYGLMRFLWDEQSGLLRQFQHKSGDGKVPLVHAEKMIGGEKERIDLYLLDPDTAVKAIRDHAYDEDWFGEVKILAAVQVEASTSVGKMKRACDKEVAALFGSKHPIEKSYLLVFPVVQLLKRGRPWDYTRQYEDLLEFLSQKQTSDWSDLKLSIYCCPAYSVPFRPPKKMEPVWIR